MQKPEFFFTEDDWVDVDWKYNNHRYVKGNLSGTINYTGSIQPIGNMLIVSDC